MTQEASELIQEIVTDFEEGGWGSQDNGLEIAGCVSPCSGCFPVGP